MEIIYIGVDFHARQQTICYLTTEGGEVLLHELKHQNKEEVRTFYAQFSGQVIVGLEASGYSPWFDDCSKNSVAKFGWAMPRRSAAARVGATRMIGAMRS